MAVLETAVVTTAKTVATKAGRVWLARRAAEADRGRDLTELIRVSFRDAVARRRVEHQIEGIALAVMERLQPLCEHELRGLTEADKAAVLAEVTEVLEEADLTDAALFEADADPVVLARDVRSRMRRGDPRFELGEAGARLFDVLLAECCDDLVRIVIELPQFEPRAAVEVLGRLSGLSEQVSTVLARIPPRSLDAPEGVDDDEEFGRRYADHVSRVLDHVELFGVQVRRYRPQTSLSVAYISLSVSAERREGAGDADRRMGHLSMTGERWHTEDRVSATMRVEAALGDRRRTLIRGEAGSGKSTLLRWLAITAVRRGFGSELHEWNGCTPFLVKLRSHADGELPRPEHFLDGTADALTGLMPRGWVHRRLRSGKALLLVDGVDELSTTQRRKVPGWLRDLLVAFPGVRVVVTSRPAAASARWLKGEGFTTAHLEPMSPDDLRELIRQWHQAIADSPGLPCAVEELPGYENSLLARLEGAPHLRALAATPLLAAMLCALNLDHATRLPRDRMGLYAATLEMLLDRRDGERGVPAFRDVDLDYAQKSRLLQDLAWRLSVSSRSELPKPVVLREIEDRLATMPRVDDTAEIVTEHLLQRSGVLREPVEGRVDFVHRTVQEYLTAKQAIYDHDVEYLVEQAHKPGWRETVVMAVGHANGPQLAELLGGILSRAQEEIRHARYLKLLAAACLETASTVPVELRGQIHACVDDVVPPRDMATARSLSTAGEAVLDRLPTSLDGLTEAQARATVHTAALINGPRALDLLTGYRQDDRPRVQHGLQRDWAYFDPGEYARRVLDDAPLRDGRLLVEAPNQLDALARLGGLRRLRQLWVHVPDLEDLSFLAGLPPLYGISLMRNQATDLGPLRHHAGTLREFHTNFDREVDPEVFTGFREMRELSVGFTGLDDISFISRMPQLDELWLRCLDDVTDFDPLMSQRQLVQLWLIDCQNLASVEQLPLTGQIAGLGLLNPRLDGGLVEVVARAPGITTLNLSDCPWVTDLEPLSALQLRELYIRDLPRVQDLSPLSLQHELQRLDLRGLLVEDLASLGELELSELYLDGCKNLSSLTPLAANSHLRSLWLVDARPGLDLMPVADNANLTIRIRAGQDVRNRDAVKGRIIEEPHKEPHSP
ncbi:NACHT domain-containing protein [Nocardiopsis halotolerans]|uniref:NACHT domain-containing protein n=1 Tax=Nocardiopsis halotolerans TaxID=124252 RepID=UPI000346D490|nr:NACHT domain-containing protein [Nocardiopsis halotolerans]